jgi:hypothetical protein
MHGKRVIFAEQYDILVILLMIVASVCGLLMNGGIDISLTLAVVPFISYFLGSNLTTNRRIADCAMSAIVLSSVPMAIMTAVGFVQKMIADVSLLEYFTSGASAVFDTPAELSVFLTVSVIFSAFVIKEKSGGARGFYLIIFLLDAIALVLASFIPSFLVIALCAILYGILAKKRNGGIIATVLAALIYLVYLLPGGILNTVLRGGTSSAEEQLLIRGEGIDIFLDNLLFGIGAGGESVYSELSSRGYYFSLDFGNIFLEIACESGIFALAIMLMILAVRIRHTGVYFQYLRSSYLLNYSVIMSVGFFAIMGFGAFSGILSDPVISFLMWFVFGMGSAILRILKNEFDDRRVYFRDQRSFDSSETEIEIRA